MPDHDRIQCRIDRIEIQDKVALYFIGEPDAITEGLVKDEAVSAADTLLVTIPNLLGVTENLRLLDNIAEHVAPNLGWRRNS
ncbi:hypothetical protein [Amycolatopsis sp. GM8]|uniref:hypothetical protein n=1 Tax=Amycolatopsis sp. GM8 TaxID=2896530 RepID=UPI001F1F8A2E|nr:hypothetical protein [Amycolatopsis sp. GM8]